MSYIGKIPANAVLTTADLADGIVTAAKIEDGTVVAAEIASNAITTAKINADAVTGAKIADDAVNSEHYTDGSIDTAHLADGQVTTAKLATAVFTGATDIGAAIVDADLFLMDDGAGGTIRKTTASRLKTYATGKVLQYVKSQSGAFAGTSQWNVSSSTPTSTNITASITPTNSSSKIIGIGFVNYNCDVSSTSVLQFGFQIQRTSDNADKTSMTPGNSVGWDSEYNASQQTRFDVYRTIPMNLYDDNHGTTSEITYRLYVRSTGSAHHNRGGAMYLNLLEVL
jgi:hypothetical protein